MVVLKYAFKIHGLKQSVKKKKKKKWREHSFFLNFEFKARPQKDC